jgi:phosphatidylglycerophosphate synthase
MPLYKVSREYQDPLDNLLYDMSDKIVPILKRFGINPNMITAFGLLCGLTTSYFLYYDKYTIAAILFGISTFCDSCDGHMARKYKMTSEFGKYFDMGSDVVRVFVLFYVMYLKNPTKLYRILFISAIFFIFSLSHLTCQQQELNEPHQLYDVIKFLCFGKKSMLITRYYGAVIFNCLLIFFIYTWNI